jgi:hypothetical protein
MNKTSLELPKENPSKSIEKNENPEKSPEKIEKKRDSSTSDNIGFNKLFILSEDNQIDSEKINEKDKENKQKMKNKGKEKNKEGDDFEYKISIDFSDLKNNKLHNYLNEDLIDAIDKSLDDPEGLDDPIDKIDKQCVSEFSHNENDTNYSQNNISNEIDTNNNFSNMNNNYQFYPRNLSNIHNTISFFPKANKKKEDININSKNKINLNGENNKDEKSKDIKKLVDYFGGSNPLDAPLYIPQKFKSLKFNQKPGKIGINDLNNINNNSQNNGETEKKEEKCKKPFEIREGDWTCEFCYNLNFAFRTKCNRCGLIKDFLQIKNNLCCNNSDSLPGYQNYIQTNYLGNSSSNSAYQFLNNNFTNTSLFSPNTSNYL